MVKCTVPNRSTLRTVCQSSGVRVLQGLEGHQASVVHHHVKATEAIHGGFHGGCNLCLRGHVACYPESIRPTGLAHLTRTVFSRIALQIGDDDACALRPETLGRSKPDPARRARDDGDLVAKAHDLSSNPVSK